MVVVNNNGVEYDVEKAIKNGTEYNIGGISRSEYDRVVALLDAANLRIIELEGLLTAANSRIAELEAQVASLQAQLEQVEDDYDFVSNLFSPVVPSNSIVTYGKWYFGEPGDWRDMVNIQVGDVWLCFQSWKTSFDTADYAYGRDVGDGIAWFVDESNNYSLTTVTGWGGTLSKGKRGGYTTYDGFWGGGYGFSPTRYVWVKGDKVLYHVYCYSYGNSDHTTTYYSYGLWKVEFDCTNKTATGQIEYNTVTTPYEYNGDEYHPIYRDHPELYYENISTHPDSTWTLVGTSTGTNLNPISHGYRLAPVKTTGDYGQNEWAGTIGLQFTKVVSS